MNTETLLVRTAKQLAALYRDKNLQTAMKLCRRAGLLFSGVDEEEQDGVTLNIPVHPEWVGIWEPEQKGSEVFYARSSRYRHEWSLWADQPTIPPRNGKTRIVFIGESVARGFFYDPVFTPAKQLEQYLNHLAGSDPGVEVIDLARTSLQGNDLIMLLNSALLLEPDCVVLFAGNNWLEESRLRTSADFLVAAQCLLDRGVPGLNSFFEDRLAEFAAGLKREMDLFCCETGIPLVFVLPEINLVDWENENREIIPYLSRAELREDAWESMQAARAKEDFTACEKYAARLNRLDGSTGVAPLLMLAELKSKLGQNEEAAAFYRQSREAQLWNCIVQSPGTYSCINRIFRSAETFEIVDLPEVFAGYLGSPLVGKELFLDYCHLNAEGIGLAMAAVASTITGILGSNRLLPRDIYQTWYKAPEPAVAAEACFAAAIHNAHWGQPGPAISYYCRRALQASAEIRGKMRAFLDAAARRVPLWLCGSVEELVAGSTPAFRKFILSFSTDYTLPKLQDAALCEALREVLPGNELSRMDECRISNYGVTPEQGIDLLHKDYCLSYANIDWYYHRTGKASASGYYRAYSPVTAFTFACAGGADLTIQLVLRLPKYTEASGAVFVSCNGTVLAELPAGQQWKSAEIAVPYHLLKRLQNTLSFAWPVATIQTELILDDLAGQLSAGLLPVFARCFGQIQTLRLRLEK